MGPELRTNCALAFMIMLLISINCAESEGIDDSAHADKNNEIFERTDPCASAMKTILCGPSTNCKSPKDKNGFTCKCKKGYKPIGSFYPTDNENTYIERCDDINECLKSTTCPKNASCINTPGSYECVCNDGFRKNPTGDACVVCDCGGREISCAFKDGKKECVCPDGFAVVDGYCKKQRCVDRKCVNGQCNVVKDQEVCNCFEGFYLDGDTCVKKPCLKAPCHNGTCVVRNNGYEQCICPSGYFLRGSSCIKNMLNLKEFV